MNTKRIEEIQRETAYPDSISVQQALLKVWNECEQEKAVKNNAVLPHVSGSFSWNIYKEQLNKMNQLPQTQSSLMTQLEILRPFANKLGLYDAADYLRNNR